MNGAFTHRLRHRANRETVEKLLRTWPANSRKLANEMIHTYGMPYEATDTLLIWHYNGPWKRTVVHRNGVQHKVPHNHTDLLEQTVDAKVRPEMFSEVAKFDGSIIIDKTRGEMTAFCESERANTLLLNLAHDICIGNKTAQEARAELLRSSGFFYSQLPNPYRESLLFTSTVETNNPDMVTAEPN